MKKLFTLVLAVAMLASMATVASAESTTTLTTTVPAATYTLNIPEDQEIAFGAEESKIGAITVTNAEGFASGKNLEVTLTYTDFVCAGLSTKIPYSVVLAGHSPNNSSAYKEIAVPSGESITFRGVSDGTVEEYVTEHASVYYIMDDTIVEIDQEAWSKALAGEYTATITFAAEVVVEE